MTGVGSIKVSLQAIKSYSPLSGTYLKVAGTGSTQNLQVVHINWFGRLLMWLGFTNACMKKVIRYVADNIEDLCRQSPDHTSLDALASRIASYDHRHSNKLYGLVIKIKQVLAKASIVCEEPTISKPPIPQAPPASPASISTTVLVAPPSSPIPLVLPIIAPVLSTPPNAAVKPQAADSVAEYANCQNDPQAVYDLLTKYGHDEVQFKALIAAITPDWIDKHAPIENTNHYDFFDLTAEKNFRITPGFIFRFMSKEQLLSIINGYFVEEWGDAVGLSLLRFVEGILTYCKEDEQRELISNIVGMEIFASLDFMSMDDTPVQNMLKSHYLLYVMNDKGDPDTMDKLKQFFHKVWSDVPPSGAFLHSNMMNLLFEPDEKAMIAQVIIEEFDQPTWHDLKMITDLINDVQWSEALFDSAGTSLKLTYLLSKCENVDALKAQTTSVYDERTFNKLMRLLQKLFRDPNSTDSLLKEHFDKALIFHRNDMVKCVSELFLNNDTHVQILIAAFIIRNYDAATWQTNGEINTLMKSSTDHAVEFFAAANDDHTKVKALITQYPSITDFEELEAIRTALTSKSPTSNCTNLTSHLMDLKAKIDKIITNPHDAFTLLVNNQDICDQFLNFFTNKQQLQPVYDIAITFPLRHEFMKKIKDKLATL